MTAENIDSVLTGDATKRDQPSENVTEESHPAKRVKLEDNPTAEERPEAPSVEQRKGTAPIKKEYASNARFSQKLRIANVLRTDT